MTTSPEADGPDVLVLSRISGGPCLVLGSTQITAGCGCVCWISPSSVALLSDRPDVETRCVRCAAATILPANTEVCSIPGSFGELSNALGPEVAAAFFTRHGLSRE